MKKLLILIAILSIVACATDKKGKQAKAKFENNIWIIDSTRTATVVAPEFPSGLMTLVPNTILKPKIDSTFGLYRDQFVRYKKYFFSGDSIFLSGGNSEYEASKYKAYKYLFKDDKMVLTSSIKPTDEFASNKEIYLTNLTTIFKGENDVDNSNFFKKLEYECWYVTLIKMGRTTFYENENPTIYVDYQALYRDKNKLICKLFLPSGEEVVKITKNSIYVYNVKDKEFKMSFRIKHFEENRDDYFQLRGYTHGKNPLSFKFKKIDKNLLIKGGLD